MDLLGGAESILQPGSACHGPFLALPDGHAASCVQDSTDGGKDQPLLHHQSSDPGPTAGASASMTDWPPGWHARQDCAVGTCPQSAPDPLDLPMAIAPQLPAVSFLSASASAAAEDASCSVMLPIVNGPTHQPITADQEMADAVQHSSDRTNSRRKRSAAAMLSESPAVGVCGAGDGMCAGGPNDAFPSVSGCQSCQAGEERAGSDAQGADAARGMSVDTPGGSSGDDGLMRLIVENGMVGGGSDPSGSATTVDALTTAAPVQTVEPGPAVLEGGAEVAAPAAATDGAATEPSSSPPDPNAMAATTAEGRDTATAAAAASTTPGQEGGGACAAMTAPAAESPSGGDAAAAAGGASSAGAGAEAGSGAGSGAAVTDTLAMELRQIMARCGGVSDTRYAGRLAALVEGEERLGGRVTLLSVVQQSSTDVLRLFVQGSGLRSLERWVVQFRDEVRLPALIKVMGCLKMLPIDLTALKGSSIGQTVGKLRKHTNAGVRTAASELVDQWKSVVDRSVGKGDARQPAKSKADTSAQDGPNKRPRKQAAADHHTPAATTTTTTITTGTAAASGKHAAAGGDGAAAAGSAATSTTATSKLALMDDDLFVSAASSLGAGGSAASHPPVPHRPLGLTSFISGAKKVHAVKLENVIPSRMGTLGGLHHAAAGGAAAAAGTSGAGDAAAGEDGAAASPTSPRGDGTAAAAEGADGAAAGPDSPKPSGDGAGPAGGGTPSLLPLAGGDGASASTAFPAAGTAPKTMTLPRLGTLAGPSNPTVRLGSLRDGSLPTSGIARLGAAAGIGGGVGGRAGTAASLPAAVAPGGPQSAHARAMAARARAPSPEPAPRKEKKKTVSWAGDDALASYRLFKKDDPPQAAASDAVLTAEDEAAAAAAGGDGGGALGGGYGGPGGGGGHGGHVGMPPPPGFQSAARREHASERMALIAQHQQEEQERQQELERLAAMRPTVPWVEPPELYLGAVSPQQLPALGEDSTEREVQARLRMHNPRTIYYSPAHIPPSPGEPPPEPEPDLHRVRRIPIVVSNGPPQMPLGAAGPGPGPVGPGGQQPPPHAHAHPHGHPPPQQQQQQQPGMLHPGMYGVAGPGAAAPHPGLPLTLPYGGGQMPPQALIPGAPPQAGQPGQPVQVQVGPPQVPGQQQQPQQQQPGPPATLTLHPDVIASLQALSSTLAQQAPGPVPGPPPQQQLPPPQQQLPPPQQPGPGQGPPGPPPPPPPPPPQGALQPPPHAQHPHPHPHPHPHALAHPHARGPPHGGAGPPPPPPPLPGQQQQPGQQQLVAPPQQQPGGPPMRPMDYGLQPPQQHAGMGPGPGPGPAGMPPPGAGPGGPGRPGSRFEPAPGMAPAGVLGPGPGQGQGPSGAPPPPPPRKDGQPALMRPRRADEPQGPAGPGPGMPLGPHPHPHPHLMGPGRAGRPHHLQGGPGGGGPAGPGAGPGGWAAAPPGPGGPGAGPPGPAMGGPPPPGPHGPSSSKMCVYFNTPGGCRNGDNCRFLHVHSQDAAYDNGPYSGPGRSGMGVGRPGGGPPPGMPGGMRRR